jgi:hypothetical protein
MLPNQLPISRPVFIGYFEYQISGICAINYLASTDILAMENLGSDINYPAHIPIIVHAYLLLTLSPMHALFSPPGINHFTHRTQQSRYRLIGAYTRGADAQLTPRDHRAAPRA